MGDHRLRRRLSAVREIQTLAVSVRCATSVSQVFLAPNDFGAKLRLGSHASILEKSFMELLPFVG